MNGSSAIAHEEHRYGLFRLFECFRLSQLHENDGAEALPLSSIRKYRRLEASPASGRSFLNVP